MSFGPIKAAPPPKLAGIEPGEVATNQKAVPLRWFSGEDWCPLVWVIKEPLNPVFTEVRQKVGKKTQTTGTEIFADLAGVTNVGLVDQVTAIEVSRELVWQGAIQRPTDPLHPDYWRAQITTGVGVFYFYWGRADQPVDDIVLAPLAAKDASQAHPGYRHQGMLVGKRIAFGQSLSAPSIRVRLRRGPKPATGDWVFENNSQGASIVGAALELLTNSIYGAGAPAALFTVGQWEALASGVLATIGRHAPSLDRERPLREVLREFFALFDGWARIEAGQIVPGRFPHDGTVPAGLADISHHDIIGDPEIGAPTPAKAANKVVVTFRDATQKLRPDTEKGISRASARARQRVQPENVETLAIIDRSQARAYAAERARVSAQGESAGTIDVRRPRAVWPGGAPLQAGDNFTLSWLPYNLTQVSRVTQVVEDYRAARVSLRYVAERGLFPLPFVPPADVQPNLGTTIPTFVAAARVLELPAPLAGTPLGISIALLANRPKSVHEGSAAVDAASVVGFRLWHSATGASYDPLGAQTTWAVRATVRVALSASAGTALVTLDATNLDADRLSAQSAPDQGDDRLLLVIGSEVLSVGTIGLSGLDRDLAVLRGRQGTSAAAASLGTEAWLVWRDELVAYQHDGFVENTDRFFKLQPYTLSAQLTLAEIGALNYHFRDRAPEAPVIVITPPAGALNTGLAYTATAQFTDINADMSIVEFSLQGLAGVASLFLASKLVEPAERAATSLSATFVFPGAGTYRLIARAADSTNAFTQSVSADLAVTLATPADPSAATKVGQGTRVAPDGTVTAWLEFSLPALAATSVRQVLRFRIATSGEYLDAADLKNSTAANVRIEGLVPGESYHVVTQSWTADNAGAIVPANASPFIAPGDTVAPAAPTNFTLISGDSTSRPRPSARIFGSSGKVAYALSLEFTESTSRDTACYHVQGTAVDTDAAASLIADVNGPEAVIISAGVAGRVSGHYYALTNNTRYLRVRAQDRSGNIGPWGNAGDAAAFLKLPVGSMTEQNASAVDISGGKVALPGLSAGITTATDVTGVNLRIFDSLGAQQMRVDAVTGEVYIQFNKVLSTRVATTPATLGDVIAVLQHHGLSQ